MMRSLVLVLALCSCDLPEEGHEESHQSAKCFAEAQSPGEAFNEAVYLRCLYGYAQAPDGGAHD